MCLAVPMKIIHKRGASGVVESGSTKKNVDLSLVKDVKKGDYVMIHAGFAIEKVRPAAARATLKAFREIDEVR